MDDTDRKHLVRCVDLAEAALATDNDPFGSVLVSSDGRVLFEDHNRTSGGDETRHPEFDIAKWAAANMTAAERAVATITAAGARLAISQAALPIRPWGRIASTTTMMRKV